MLYFTVRRFPLLAPSQVIMFSQFCWSHGTQNLDTMVILRIAGLYWPSSCETLMFSVLIMFLVIFLRMSTSDTSLELSKLVYWEYASSELLWLYTCFRFGFSSLRAMCFKRYNLGSLNRPFAFCSLCTSYWIIIADNRKLLGHLQTSSVFPCTRMFHIDPICLWSVVSMRRHVQ